MAVKAAHYRQATGVKDGLHGECGHSSHYFVVGGVEAMGVEGVYKDGGGGVDGVDGVWMGVKLSSFPCMLGGQCVLVY